MIVLDTQVLLYAVGRDHPLAEPCARLIDAIGARRVQATTTVEVIQEFAHVRSRSRTRDDAAGLAIEFAQLLSPLLIIDTEGLIEGMEQFRRHASLDSFDAVLAAAVAQADADALVTADRDFDPVEGLRIWRPDGPELSALLG